jgi:hypothetical protein
VVTVYPNGKERHFCVIEQQRVCIFEEEIVLKGVMKAI